MSETHRCFVAVNIPDSLKKEIFERLSEKIPARECKVVEQQNLHITMLFLGNLSEDAISEMKQKMQALTEFRAFDAELGGAGDFRGRVFWVGASKGAGELEAIAQRLQELLEMRDEKFSAHLTIARNKFLQKKETNAMLVRLQKENFSAGFRVESVDFMESVLSPKGPKYEKLFSIGLGA